MRPQLLRWCFESSLTLWLRVPAACLYGFFVGVRRWLYHSGVFRGRRVNVPVISVGALAVGGSGKTPVAAYLLEVFQRAGKAPGLLSRGYGRQGKGLVLRFIGEAAEASRLGDEPAMLVAGGADVPMAICSRRIRGAEALEASGSVDVLVMDDGFVHRALVRDVDIVVLDARSPLGVGHLLPWGPMREPWSSLRRAQIIWLHDKLGDGEPIPITTLREQRSQRVVTSRVCVKEVLDGCGRSRSLSGRKVLAAAGIARPESFFSTLKGLGADLVCFRSFADHYAYTSHDVEALLDDKERLGAEVVVVTAKDMVKLRALWPVMADLLYVELDLEIVSGKAGLARVLHVEQRFL